MKKDNISLPKAFIVKQEEPEEWMEEEETFEDEWLNVKGILALINDTPDGDSSKCDVDTSQAVQ